MTTFELQPITARDVKSLQNFLYLAIFVPEGQPPASRELIQSPDLAIYIDDFGQKAGDYGLFAIVDGLPVGAAWVRLIQDYGYIDEQTPSLAISFLPDWRGQGLGSQLLLALLTDLKKQGYQRVSLSVQKANPAWQLYKRLGFKVYQTGKEEDIMVFDLDQLPK